MASVTVVGTKSQIITLPFTASANIGLATQLAGAITAGVTAKSILPFSSLDGPPPPLPPGKIGEFVVQTGTPVFLPPGYDAVVADHANSVVFGSGDNGEAILSGTGGLTFFAPGGSGTVAAGGGKNNVIVSPTAVGPWWIATGNGDDIILALGRGNDTIQPGTGHNSVILGGGNDVVQLTGFDSVSAGMGSATIDATQAKSTYVQGGSGNLLLLGGEGSATIFGGTGSVTLIGGHGSTVVHGGTGGNNLLFAGDGAATLFGGGNGDQLFAGGANQALHAGSGNETLSAFLGFSGNTLYGGSGHDQLIGGFGADTFVAGTGAATMTAGAGSDVFDFIHGSAGGKDLIVGFQAGDLIDLQGYGAGAIKAALKTETVGPNGVTITLSDHTSITFAGLFSLSASDFTTSGPVGRADRNDDVLRHHTGRG